MVFDDLVTTKLTDLHLQVAASSASEGAGMNELYGEGGSRKKEQLFYSL